MVFSLPECRDDGRFAGLRVGIITAGSHLVGGGGAERFYLGLQQGFEAIGCTTAFVPVPASEPSTEQILDNYRLAKACDVSQFDLVVSSKVPTYAVCHPRHVVYLNHAVRVFDDMFVDRFGERDAEAFADRARVLEADFEALGRVTACIAQGYEVARRLTRWRGMTAPVLHPPLGYSEFRFGDHCGDYFVIAGRLHRWKRLNLLIGAVRHSALPMRLLIAGDGEHAEELRHLAGDDPRIQFCGRVSDDELIELYAGAIAIPFVPLREDYGYVTLEAFRSGKPVLTCTDSGEPAHLVRHGSTGLIVEPTPTAICAGMEWFWTHRQAAAAMGQRGYEQVCKMSWADTAFALARAAHEGAAAILPATPKRVAVLDMQPIDPPLGGGRIRLLGLYHNLGHASYCNYVGTYDWPGERFRAHALSPTLFETDVPLSEAHHRAAAELATRAGGKNVIDLAFSRQAHLSPEFVAEARNAASEADVVIFSHPWVYPLVKDCLRPNQVVIYDSQNVEGFLRAQLLDGANPVEREVLEGLVADELAVGQRADWILACSHEDLQRFARLYGFSPERMRVVPNGVMAFAVAPASDEERLAARRALGLAPDAFAGIFIGSGYGPNVDAARFINEALAPACPKTTFVIAGGVGTGMVPTSPNVVITGQIDNSVRDDWFRAMDFALNPMMAGSGTNIKMFDYMAMGLPVITTEAGARGIETGGEQTFRVAPPTVEDFLAEIQDLRNMETRKALGSRARTCVTQSYAWERISNQLGRFVTIREATAGQTLPLFSVVIPSYERPDQLEALLCALQSQTDRDFEAVIVDQSQRAWNVAEQDWGFPVNYYHSPVKGAVRARNTGAMLAQGRIIAFVDDDCLPEADWLLNARPYFEDVGVVGLEGLIRSDHEGDPEWRQVTNVGFEGIGFMTANLMVRSSAFQWLGGFDLQFDNPHFREDTDFGWRLQDLGKVPYGRDVVVFHPAQPRSIARESLAERTRFFSKDALLYRKHPGRYRELFFREGHFCNTAGFGKILIDSLGDIGITKEQIPAWMSEALNE
jgi:glycosyltransferase involved in cell wall biosynthesis